MKQENIYTIIKTAFVFANIAILLVAFYHLIENSQNVLHYFMFLGFSGLWAWFSIDAFNIFMNKVFPKKHYYTFT